MKNNIKIKKNYNKKKSIFFIKLKIEIIKIKLQYLDQYFHFLEYISSYFINILHFHDNDAVKIYLSILLSK